ncbi:MAG: DUF167 domain-containing protein [Phycisphaerales bacterium]|nr:DUF167 domain-containing protein [Phycisphaerales bacterium]
MSQPAHAIIEPDPDHADAIRIRVKAVPGAKQDAIAGILGDRLKVRVSAAPEGGKANKAICELLARVLKCKPRDVEIISGHTNPEKLVRIQHATPADASRLLKG